MPANLMDVDAFTSPVVVPEDGDDYDAISVETPFQALSNRTRNLKNRVDALPSDNTAWTGNNSFSENVVLNGSGNEVIYSSPNARTVMLPTQGIQPQFSTQLFGAENGQFLLASAFSTYRMGFRIPNGATLIGVILEARHESSPATPLSWGISRLTWNSGAIPTAASCRAAGADSLAAGTAHQQRLFTCDQNNLASGATWFVIEFTSSDTASGTDPDLIHAIRYTFMDPGPRNY